MTYKIRRKKKTADTKLSAATHKTIGAVAAKNTATMASVLVALFMCFQVGAYAPRTTIAANVEQISQSQYSYAGGFDHDAFLRQMGEDYQNRSVKSPQKDREAALFIAGFFAGLGYLDQRLAEVPNPQGYFSEFSAAGKYETQNIVAVKQASADAANSPSVIIGAHYDNVYDYEIKNPYSNRTVQTLSNGIYDNASGVAVMLAAAQDLKEIQLDFNVYFVAFGAEELGMLGSRHYVSLMSEWQKQNTLLMVNIDSVAGGDYLYLFSQDWQVPHDSYLRSIAQQNGISLRSFPADKRFMADPLKERAYSHAGHLSDSYYFMNETINTAFFTSLNMDTRKKAAIAESEHHDNIIHTSNDYYEKLKELYPHYLVRMQQVTDIITDALKDSNFVGEMQQSTLLSPNYSFLTEKSNMVVVAMMLCLLFIILSVIYYIKLKSVAKVKMEQFLNDPKQIEKINTLFKEFENMNTGLKVLTYHPRTYKPKPGDNEFTVFGSEFEKKDDNYIPRGETDSDEQSDSDQETKDSTAGFDISQGKYGSIGGRGKDSKDGSTKRDKKDGEKNDDSDDIFRFKD